MKKMNKLLIKIISISIVFIVLFQLNIVLADLEDNEQIDINEIKSTVIETSTNMQGEPKLNSRIALIYDRASGRILYEKNGNKQTPMASTTKIMTSIVVLENSDLEDIVIIDDKSARTGGSRLGLKKNDKITIKDLLYGLMLCSGNDAAMALAIHVGGSVENFANMMNKKAEELGLINSHFILPHGLDMKEHYTTAYELAKTADYALNLKKIREIVSTKSYTVTINGQPKNITNTNELLGNLNGVYGVKTGFTNGAGRCLVTACKRDNLDIITVVIGADAKKYRTSDSMQLIEYAYKNFKMIPIKEKIEEQFESWKRLNQNRITIDKGVKNNIELGLEELNYENMAVKNTQVDNIKIEINAIYELEAPVEEKKTIGNVKIMVGEDIIEILEIYNKEMIRKKEVRDYLIQFFTVYSQ